MWMKLTSHLVIVVLNLVLLCERGCGKDLVVMSWSESKLYDINRADVGEVACNDDRDYWRNYCCREFITVCGCCGSHVRVWSSSVHEAVDWIAGDELFRLCWSAQRKRSHTYKICLESVLWNDISVEEVEMFLPVITDHIEEDKLVD